MADSPHNARKYVVEYKPDGEVGRGAGKLRVVSSTKTVRITAKSKQEAIAIFREVYPDLRLLSIYSVNDALARAFLGMRLRPPRQARGE